MHVHVRCGRKRPGYICDQHLYLNQKTNKLDGLAQQIAKGEGMDVPCSSRPDVKGYVVGVALGELDTLRSRIVKR